ncbi:MAG: hypothetical protein GY847_04655 [Proteobacteria bacterium]|nr:hypothetical protein [Pseudomonadota bacterium]
MSAFLVSDLHINVLVEWARREQMSWGVRDKLTCEEVAQELRAENERSFNYRYQEEGHYPVKFGRVALPVNISATTIIKLCDCYKYQSCEHDGWENSRANKIVTEIRETAIRSLPGYREAPWGLEDLSDLGPRVESSVARYFAKQIAEKK